MKKNQLKSLSYLVLSASLVSSLFVSKIALADDGNVSGSGLLNIKFGIGKHDILGVVTATNGNILTVSSKSSEQDNAQASYSVDASNATIIKNGASSTISSILVGDNVAINGTVTDSNITAASIRDGLPGLKLGWKNKDQASTSPDAIQGNGLPIIGGTITAINGSTLTVTNKSNITYTVDASNAKINKNHASSSLSSLTVGDNVVIQGSTNGTLVTASSVLDAGSTASVKTNVKTHSGFFFQVGNFFHKLFGFF